MSIITTVTQEVSTKFACPICHEEFCPDGGDDTMGQGWETDKRSGFEAVLSRDSSSSSDPLGGNEAVLGERRRCFRVDGCGHQFCHECLVQHCKYSIMNRNIPVPCPERHQQQPSDQEKDDEKHCLTPEFVKMILMVPLLGINDDATKRKDTAEENSTKDNSNNHQTLQVIQLSRTISSSSSSNSSVSSTPEYWNKYLRFQSLNENRSLVICPNCDDEFTPPSINNPAGQGFLGKNNKETFQDLENPSLVTNHDDALIIIRHYPQLACPSCHYCFCAIHGDSHIGMTCEEFAKTVRGQDILKSEIAIREMTKKCSHVDCGAPIARIGGCAHIICTNCHRDFCWDCGTHLYLTGKVIRSCGSCKKGYVDHRYFGRYRFRMLLVLPLYLLFGAIYFAVVGAGAILSFGFCCCFCCGTRGLTSGEPATSSSFSPSGSRFTTKIRPVKGICMGARLFCFPMLQLIRDCGFLPHTDDNEVRS
jgi:IBR domain, a half RING-finger domain